MVPEGTQVSVQTLEGSCGLCVGADVQKLCERAPGTQGRSQCEEGVAAWEN